MRCFCGGNLGERAAGDGSRVVCDRCGSELGAAALVVLGAMGERVAEGVRRELSPATPSSVEVLHRLADLADRLSAVEMQLLAVQGDARDNARSIVSVGRRVAALEGTA